MDTVRSFRDQLGITFPLLLDTDRVVVSRFEILERTVQSALYPQEWIIGHDGRIAYVNTIYEPDEMKAVIDADLAVAGSK